MKTTTKKNNPVKPDGTVSRKEFLAKLQEVFPSDWNEKFSLLCARVKRNGADSFDYRKEVDPISRMVGIKGMLHRFEACDDDNGALSFFYREFPI